MHYIIATDNPRIPSYLTYQSINIINIKMKGGIAIVGILRIVKLEFLLK